MDHPVVVLVSTVIVIVAFAGPIVRIKTNVPTATSLPTSQQARQGYDILQARFDRGALSPVEVLVTWQGAGAAAQPTAPQNLAALYGYGKQLAALPDVAGVTSIVNQPGLTSQEAVQTFWYLVLGRGLAGTSPPASQPFPGQKGRRRQGAARRDDGAQHRPVPGRAARRSERWRGPVALPDDQGPDAAAGLHRPRGRPVGRHP